jgi:hypothetical protein
MSDFALSIALGIALATVIQQRFYVAVHESAFGTKRTWQSRSPMSAFGGKADIAATKGVRVFNYRTKCREAHCWTVASRRNEF